ncbi:hypothetical protein Taro_046653 [Colocasia esculenta]|uniref:BHLH domain-containing protein n=1 Tax=Colocasia esculenta TaxID=4460 RepID=A0A843WQJ9_COLES|nr:hypothetical protein [Colocasia esculenta]
MMDDTNITSASSTSPISSLLLGHLLSSSTTTSCVPTSASTSSPFQGILHHHWGRQIPFSSYSGASHDAAVPTEGGAAAASLGFDPVALLQSSVRRGPQAVDLDPYDGESEEGAEVSEGRPKPPPPRSGSKRSRAAEVHNLSEKRRRSRINEKMKALQNLIPNSNKTDKASMLDEAIEYLKQLQLQVQMLSMRNGLSLQSVYLPSTLQSLQASQVRLGLGVDNAINSAVTSIGMEASQFHHGSFPFSLHAEDMYNKEDMVQQHRLDSGHVARNLSGDEMKSMNTATLPFEGQASSVAGTDNLEACMLSCGSLQRGRGASSNDMKAEMLEFR